MDMAELKNWISFTQRRYIEDDVNRQWKQHNPENADKLHWEVSVNFNNLYINSMNRFCCDLVFWHSFGIQDVR